MTNKTAKMIVFRQIEVNSSAVDSFGAFVTFSRILTRNFNRKSYSYKYGHNDASSSSNGVGEELGLKSSINKERKECESGLESWNKTSGFALSSMRKVWVELRLEFRDDHGDWEKQRVPGEDDDEPVYANSQDDEAVDSDEREVQGVENAHLDPRHSQDVCNQNRRQTHCQHADHDDTQAKNHAVLPQCLRLNENI